MKHAQDYVSASLHAPREGEMNPSWELTKIPAAQQVAICQAPLRDVDESSPTCRQPHLTSPLSFYPSKNILI